MKSHKEYPAKLELNILHNGRRPGERLKVIKDEDFGVIELVGAPEEQDWKRAPGLPYDDGLAEARPGKLVEWTEEEKALLTRYQAMGNMQAVVQMMKEKSDATTTETT